MQCGGLCQGPLILLAVLEQVAFIFLQQEIVQLALFGNRDAVLTQSFENRVDLIQVDRHVSQAFPVIGAAVRHDALPQIGIDLVQQHTKTGYQRLQRILGVCAFVLVPKCCQQLLVGDRCAFIQDQILNQRRAFLGLGSKMVCFPLIDKDQEVIHHLNANRIGHGKTLLRCNLQNSYISSL